jgi:cytohesin
MAHFVWEASLLAVGAAGGLRLLKNASPSHRYAMLALFMLAMPVCAGVTCFIVAGASRTPETALGRTVDSAVKTPTAVRDADTHESIGPAIALGDGGDLPADGLIPADTASKPIRTGRTSSVARAPESSAGSAPVVKPAEAAAGSTPWGPRVAPGIVALYYGGVALMLVRLSLGIFRGAGLRGESRPVMVEALLDAYRRQLKVSGLGFVPALLFCERVVAPAVVGILKPAVLLPVSICNDLSMGQVELLLAHELAHIRRRDQYVDLVQRMIEAFFFFHPAVWYVSRAIRLEREKCCDDIVVRQGDSRLSYAGALVRVAELSSRAAWLGRRAVVGQSAAGRPSQLNVRILRLIGLGAPGEICPSRGALLAAIAGTLAAALFGAHWLTTARAQAPVPVAAPQQNSPYRRVYANGVTVEVLAVTTPPSRSKPFWDPAGLRLVDAPYESLDGTYAPVGGKKKTYKIITRVTGAKDRPIHVESRAADGISVGYGGTPYRAATAVDDLRVFDCEVPESTDVMDFELGVAANTWHAVRTFKDNGVYGQGPDKVIVADANQRGARSKTVQFTVKLAPRQDALRLIAIDGAGAEHVSKGSLWMGRDDYTIEADFPDLPREKAKEYRIESCAYEWKSFKSIHLKPQGDWQKLFSQARAARLMGQELKFKPADVAKIDDAIEKIERLKVFDDTDVWVGAIRDLSEIGPPAVPAIVAEIQKTSRPYARSGLAIALRAIGDPRAVPGLIESLATCPFAPNDYGGGRTKDPLLLHFMLGVQREGGYGMSGGPSFSMGRPVNEITITLEWLTDHSEGHEQSKGNDRARYEKAADRWRTWWEANKGPFLDGLPVMRIVGNPGQKPLTPVLPSPQHLAADLKANPKLAGEPVLDRWTLLHLAVVGDRSALVHTLVEGGADVNAGGDGGWTALHLAAALGQADTVQYLLDHKADVNAKTDGSCTPLLAAAGNCDAPFYAPMPAPNLAIVKLLIDKGADIKATDVRGRTALHGAAAGADAAVVKLLLDHGSPANAKDARGRTPLHLAVQCNREAAVDLLLAAGADVNARDTGGLTPMRLSPYSLHYTTFNSPIVKTLLDHGAEVDLETAMALGSIERVAAAIKKDPAAVNRQPKTSDDRSPLQWAISRKSPELVKLLLDGGADPNAKDKTGNPPLTSAVFSGNQEAITMLLAAKADVNSTGQGGCLPLYWACSRLDTGIVDQLLAAGAKPIAADPDAPNPLSAALQAPRDQSSLVPGTAQEKIERAKTIVSALLAHGADVNQRVQGFTPIYSADNAALATLLFDRGAKLDVTDNEGDTPLHYAAILSRLELFQFLLEHKVALEVKNKKGETPLHCAVGYFAPKGDLLKQLLDAGADLAARDAEGKTPLHRAVQQGSPASVTALLQKGADPDARDKEGATPLHLAAKIGGDELILILLKHDATIDARDAAGLTPLQWVTKDTTRALLTAHGAGPAGSGPATAPSQK